MKASSSYNTIQYKHEYYYSGINPVEFRGHRKGMIEDLSFFRGWIFPNKSKLVPVSHWCFECAGYIERSACSRSYNALKQAH